MTVATIGSALAEKRRELGLEKGQAADRIGMSRTTYSSYEQDAQRPSVDVFPALAEFLVISMEELLSLYGATCVAAVRPSLERVLSNDESLRGEGVIFEEVPSDAESPTARPESGSEEDSSPSEVELELSEVSEPSEESESTPSEVVLELTELSASSEESESTLRAGVLDQSEPSTQPDAALLEAIELSEPARVPESVEVVREVPVVHALPREDTRPTPIRSEEPSAVGSVVFEPSPYFIKVPTAEERAKSSGEKKKKKKKKKNKN